MKNFVRVQVSLLAVDYESAIKSRFATIPYFEWITDSMAFWLKIKTPGIDTGKRKKGRKK